MSLLMLSTQMAYFEAFGNEKVGCLDTAGYSAVRQQPNERMQLTWLPGTPNRSASVHRLVVGQGGLGSPATQLMRAVGRLVMPVWNLDVMGLP